MFLIRYHFIIAEQGGCELLDINLGKPAAWFGLYEQMQFLFNLCIEMKQKLFAAHASVWYLIFGKTFCPSGHNFTSEILKGSHTTTGQQKSKLSYTKISKVQNAKNCMEWICEEFESIWDLVQEFAVQISLIKWKESRRTNNSVSAKYCGEKRVRKMRKGKKKEKQQAGWRVL